MIQEELGMEAGDKMVISNSLKSIVSHVAEKQHLSESGLPVDILFSTTGVMNRIVSSPISVGIVERNMDALKQNVLTMYFD